jgi:hypothetical protein
LNIKLGSYQKNTYLCGILLTKNNLIMKKVLLLLSVLFTSFGAFAGDHPQANFGIYGIQHHKTLSEYQAVYTGQIVKYLPNSMSNGSYQDEEHFLNNGGDYNKEYIISKISGNNERMTFQLTERDGKAKVKLVVNNQDEYYSHGKYCYCITDTYSLPLFLVGKFNEDKANYIGKSFDNGNLEITDAQINKVEWKVGESYKAYPNIVYVVTDKSDGEKYYVDANSVSSINELGQTYTNPSYKCSYKVVGVNKKVVSKHLYSYHYYDTWEKYYTVKNSISGKTKEVVADDAQEKAFEFDNLGHFVATLSKVEKPTNATIRYGTTTTITDKDITKFSYVDNIIDILIFASSTQFQFILKNVSENTIKVVWNEAVFVDVDGSTSKVMHSGVKYSQREADQPPSTIIKGAKLEDLAAPTAKVYYSDVLKEWESKDLCENASKNSKEQTIKLMLPIQVKDVVNEYIFEFNVDYKYFHPEYLVNQ